MKIKVLLVLMAIFFGQQVVAQNILNAKTPKDVRKAETVDAFNPESIHYNEPLPYGHVDDRDIMWTKNVWEVIDLNQKVNFPYFFPKDTITFSRFRISLFDAMQRGIRSNKITELFADPYFNAKITTDQALSSLCITDTTDIGIEQYNDEGQVSIENIIQDCIQNADIEQYRIRGIWYFDKRQGEMRYRLLAFAPVGPDVYDLRSENPELVEYFWVWYADARKHLHQFQIFNPKNSFSSVSFDDMFNARRFSSVIYKVENEYGDRAISEYMEGKATRQLLESERLREQLRNFEIDQWVY